MTDQLQHTCTYLHNGVIWVYCECDALNDTEGPQDESEEGWDGEGVGLAQRLKLSHH